MPKLKGFRIISGRSHVLFAQKIAEKLEIQLTKVEVNHQGDSETILEIKESIRDKHIFIVQSKTSDVNDSLMELLIMIHTCKLASARRITAVMPYFPYSRQDQKKKGRTPITAKLLANLLERSGVDQVITMDLHSPQIQGFFNIPVDNLFAEPMIIKHIKDSVPDWQKAVIVSPDAGGTKRATSVASKLDLDIALIHRQKHNHNLETLLVGNVAQKTAIIIDDLIDTGQTVVRAFQKLKESKASKVYAIVTHGILSGKACEKLNSCELEKMIVTNTIAQEDNLKQLKKLLVIDVSPVFAEAIKRTHSGQPVSYLFTNVPPNK